MSSFRIRPRFKHLMKGIQKEALESKISMALKQNDQFTFNHLPGHIYIRIHPNSRHIWSPQLHLTFEQEEDNVIVRGLYGPNPTLWGFFFLSYAGISILALFLGMWGTSLWSLGKDASILWGLPVLGTIALGLYLVSQGGQKLGAQEMFDIHHFYEEITYDKVIVN